MNPQIGISIHNVGIDYVAKHNFKRVQLCHKFSGAKEITALLKFSRKFPLKVTYHAPVFHQSDPTVTYYVSDNKRLRDATFEILKTNLSMAKSLPTSEVVIHFVTSNVGSPDSIKRIAQESALRLSELSKEYDLPIFLEYVGYNDLFYKIEDWIDIIKDHENLGICLDVGHLYLSCQINNMDYFKELEKILPYIRLIHLWNTRGFSDVSKYGHIPVHPNQNPNDGWIDIEKTIELIYTWDDDIPIIFEPDFKYLDLKYAQEGIDWVNELVYNNTKKDRETIDTV
ncbi:sugar phosphate isomerase/epimerase family protein [Caloranaerobacter ferrireducens]|uniref:sugar phosphate isomerase/epimerase family protein n=1 Tax=Caloranaerobacter ferrireducens TaxID=1323370 RepID=UPI00084DD507|nr:TIM barrel protein [Caloranaerobacter ferrireducens]